MKVDLTQVFQNANDTPAIDAVTKEPITLKEILLQVCLAEGTKPEEKVKRWNLYRTIKKSKVPFVLLEAEEIALLKKAVTETHSTLVVGQAHEMLETAYVEPPPKSGPRHYDTVDVSKARKPTARKDPDDYKDVE